MFISIMVEFALHYMILGLNIWWLLNCFSEYAYNFTTPLLKKNYHTEELRN